MAADYAQIRMLSGAIHVVEGHQGQVTNQISAEASRPNPGLIVFIRKSGAVVGLNPTLVESVSPSE